MPKLFTYTPQVVESQRRIFITGTGNNVPDLHGDNTKVKFNLYLPDAAGDLVQHVQVFCAGDSVETPRIGNTTGRALIVEAHFKPKGSAMNVCGAGVPPLFIPSGVGDGVITVTITGWGDPVTKTMPLDDLFTITAALEEGEGEASFSK
jgi:hypothetical protein